MPPAPKPTDPLQRDTGPRSFGTRRVEPRVRMAAHLGRLGTGAALMTGVARATRRHERESPDARHAQRAVIAHHVCGDARRGVDRGPALSATIVMGMVTAFLRVLPRRADGVHVHLHSWRGLRLAAVQVSWMRLSRRTTLASVICTPPCKLPNV